SEAHPTASVEMIPGGKGAFIVIGEGQELWNKYESDRFPENHEILDKLSK
ncbi:MAG: Rdx family protein, partial [Kofleriaceae bacterium]|nr:Rdx family protein [Kofleriaceae bacterium]